MTDWCPLACGLCGDTPADCVDDYPDNCPSYASQGQCDFVFTECVASGWHAPVLHAGGRPGCAGGGPVGSPNKPDCARKASGTHSGLPPPSVPSCLQHPATSQGQLPAVLRRVHP